MQYEVTISLDGRPREKFYFSNTWSMVRPSQQVVPWHAQVWFKGAVPKHAFTLWLCFLDRLPTRSRLQTWGLIKDDTCPLCEIFSQSRDYLFLRCPFSSEHWRWTFSKLWPSFIRFNSWPCFHSWLRSSTSNRSFSSLKLISTHVVIYSIWTERNARIFSGVRTPTSAFLRGLDRWIWNTCSARRHYARLKDALQLWFRGTPPALFLNLFFCIGFGRPLSMSLRHFFLS